MSNTIIFIHGMFQNPKSWEKWISYFEINGYTCKAPAWPYHEGEPSQLRENIPSELGNLRLQTVIDQLIKLIEGETEKPILIGHSVGGLIVQSLINKNLGKLGVCISSVAPNRMLAFDWGLFKNAVSITNPLKGNDPYLMDAEGFHANFANTLSEAASNKAYEQYATHDSRNMLRDCMLEAGEVDMDLPHVPLLFIGGEKDEIIPPELNEKNSKAYKDEESISDFKEFPNRSHYICGEPGWEEIANHVYEWIQRHKPVSYK